MTMSMEHLNKLDVRDVLMLERVQRAHFQYFLDFQCKETGLILDRSQHSPATIAGVGFALTAYAIACEREWVSRAEAVSYTLRVLKVLAGSPQGDSVAGTSGYRGFFYHFLDPKTGLRAMGPEFWPSELSSIDTALLMAGVNFAGSYYTGADADQKEIRRLARFLYERVEWTWLLRDNGLIGHGWSPEGGMIQHDYHGYSEALLLYLQAIGSPTHPVPPSSWTALLSECKLATYRDQRFITMPGTPLFCYQYPHCWVDFHGIRDDLGRKFGLDYFENSQGITLAQFTYAQENPGEFRGYGAFNWGLTASDGPGEQKPGEDKSDSCAAHPRTFWSYRERGAPYGADDGTIAPTAAVSSLPFAPHLVLPTIRYWLQQRPELFSMHGFTDAFNPTWDLTQPSGWVDQQRLAIDQGPIVLMIENYRSEMIWQVMRRNPNFKRALKLAGFKGGWLSRRRAAPATNNRRARAKAVPVLQS